MNAKLVFYFIICFVSELFIFMEAQSLLFTPNLTVALDGSGDYKTITEAIEASPTFLSTSRFVIHIKQGVYREHVYVPFNRTQLTFIGDGMGKTKVVDSRSNLTGYGTAESATVAVDGHGFMARDIAFINAAGPRGGQAVALRSHSNLSVFYRCSIEGYQDSLYAHHHIQFYRDCNIYGTIDFIFGVSTVVLQNCNIFGRRPLPSQAVMITADGRDSKIMDSGIVMHNCTIIATPELEAVKKSVSSFLGRPWKTHSTTIIMQSFIGDFIAPEGWSPWTKGDSGRLSTIEYDEFRNRGPGANTVGRVKWPGFKILKEPKDVVRFTVTNFIKGHEWLPATGVPFIPGLI